MAAAAAEDPRVVYYKRRMKLYESGIMKVMAEQGRLHEEANNICNSVLTSSCRAISLSGFGGIIWSVCKKGKSTWLLLPGGLLVGMFLFGKWDYGRRMLNFLEVEYRVQEGFMKHNMSEVGKLLQEMEGADIYIPWVLLHQGETLLRQVCSNSDLGHITANDVGDRKSLPVQSATRFSGFYREEMYHTLVSSMCCLGGLSMYNIYLINVRESISIFDLLVAGAIRVDWWRKKISGVTKYFDRIKKAFGPKEAAAASGDEAK